MSTTQELIALWSKESCGRPEILFVKNLRAKGLTDEAILIVLQELDRICQFCFDSNVPCPCMRDE